MLNTMLSQALTLFINPCLSLDPEFVTLLASLKGKTFGVKIEDWNLEFAFIPKKSRIEVEPSAAKTDILLTGKLFDLACLALSKNPQTLLSTGKVSIDGPLGILEAYQAFFNHLELDWEGFLANFMGDTLAHKIVKSLREFIDLQKKNHQRSLLDITEYVQEEKQLFPPREEVEDFFADISELADDIARLEVRIAQFMR